MFSADHSYIHRINEWFSKMGMLKIDYFNFVTMLKSHESFPSHYIMQCITSFDDDGTIFKRNNDVIWTRDHIAMPCDDVLEKMLVLLFIVNGLSMSFHFEVATSGRRSISTKSVRLFHWRSSQIGWGLSWKSSTRRSWCRLKPVARFRPIDLQRL